MIRLIFLQSTCSLIYYLLFCPLYPVENSYQNVYEFDMDAAIKAGFKLLRFDAYDQDWLNFIVASRNGKQPWTGYDIIEGGEANDRVIDTIEDYLNDIITIEQALGQFVYAQPNHQICLLNQQGERT